MRMSHLCCAALYIAALHHQTNACCARWCSAAKAIRAHAQGCLTTSARLFGSAHVYGLRRYKAVSGTDSELYVLRRVEGLRVVSEIGSQTLQVCLRNALPHSPWLRSSAHLANAMPTHHRRSCKRTRRIPTSERDSQRACRRGFDSSRPTAARATCEYP